MCFHFRCITIRVSFLRVRDISSTSYSDGDSVQPVEHVVSIGFQLDLRP